MDPICVNNEVNLISALEMACGYSRRIILSLMKIMNFSPTIAVDIFSPNIKILLQMRINIRLQISAKAQKSQIIILIVATFC